MNEFNQSKTLLNLNYRHKIFAAENLKVVGASVVTVPQNIKSTITCTVETDVDPEYIKTYWFK